MIVQRKGIEKRNPKSKNLSSIEYHFHENRPKGSYQGGYTVEIKEIQNSTTIEIFLQKNMFKKTVSKIVSKGSQES